MVGLCNRWREPSGFCNLHRCLIICAFSLIYRVKSGSQWKVIPGYRYRVPNFQVVAQTPIYLLKSTDVGLPKYRLMLEGIPLEYTP